MHMEGVMAREQGVEGDGVSKVGDGEADAGRREVMKAVGRWAVAAPVMAVLISTAGRNPANAYLGGD